MTRSGTHCVVIPSYNTGPILQATLHAARAAWDPVWLVIDGSTDGPAVPWCPAGGLHLIRRARNGGKGAAVLDALRPAAAAGYTHALIMDADGQHPADAIAAFMAESAAEPAAMILGTPRFGSDAPAARVHGRRLSNALARVQTRGAPGAPLDADVLFGFRVYPIAPLLAAFARSRGMRGFDFDPEAAVRLTWAGVPAVTLPVPVRYLRPDGGGVSHFRYVRDNLLLAAMHLRLLLAAPRSRVRHGS